jgi:alpha-L-fucosidase 2
MLCQMCILCANSSIDPLDQYNVVWDTPSQDSSGSMPIGNGDIGLNVWVEENDDLLFYISKTDAWNENCHLLKLARIRIKLSPNPFKTGYVFKQTLRLRQGEIEVTAGKGEDMISIRIWVDANQPVIRVEAKGKKEFDIQASLEVWRTDQAIDDERALSGSPEPVISTPDKILPAKDNRIIWYHRNESSCYPITLKNQHLEKLLAKYPDPLMSLTFGGCLKGEGLTAIDDQTIKSHGPAKNFRISIYPLTSQTDTIEKWLDQLDANISKIDKKDFELTRTEHREWWDAFWNRSWIYVKGIDGSDDLTQVTRGYILQRWITASGGRGAYPIKFNGSIFTVDGYEGETKTDPDYRRWGGNYWFQNTRLAYWQMLASGDFDLMKPFFKMYLDALPFALDRTMIYYNHNGAFFPETMHFWGVYSNTDFGWGNKENETQNTYIKYYWSGGIELTTMMIEYYLYTQDIKFANTILMPFADSIITFFAQHWKYDANGKIRFEPSESLETWHEAVNPLPEIAGLKYVIDHLLEFPTNLVTEKQKGTWKKILESLPPIPMKEEDGKRFLLPAEKFDRKSNSENPELYAVFPYRIYGLGKPDLEIGLETYTRRIHKNTGGWQQDAIQSACLGLKEEASSAVFRNFTTKHDGSRFPAFWGPNFDWIPDQDHGSVAMKALQNMLVQDNGKEILLFPAWKKAWDVEFKLCTRYNTTIEGSYCNGTLESLKVTPQEREKDVVLKFDVKD